MPNDADTTNGDDEDMKQKSRGLDMSNRKPRKRALLATMQRAVPGTELLALISPHAPVAKTGRPPFPIESMLRIHVLQQ